MKTYTIFYRISRVIFYLFDGLNYSFFIRRFCIIATLWARNSPLSFRV